MLTRVCGKNLNIVSMCAVSPVVHTSKIYSCQKGCEQFHYGRSFGFHVIHVCNHGEHYETPCIVPGSLSGSDIFFPQYLTSGTVLGRKVIEHKMCAFRSALLVGFYASAAINCHLTLR